MSTEKNTLNISFSADDPASLANALKQIGAIFNRRIDELDRKVAALRLVPRLLAMLETRPEISGALAAAPPGHVLQIVTDAADALVECGGDFDEAAAKFAGEVKEKLRLATVDGAPVGEPPASPIVPQKT